MGFSFIIVMQCFFARRAIVFAIIGSATKKNMCESLSVRVCDVWCNASDCRIARLQDHLRAIFKNIEFWSFLVALVKVFSEFWVRVLEMRADDCRCWYQDCRIARSRLQDCKILRAIFQKVEFWVLFGVLVKVFSKLWVRFWRWEQMIADVDIKIAWLSNHYRIIISNKVYIFYFFETQLPFGPPCPAGVI